MECARMAYAKIKVSSLPNTAYVAPPKPRPANRKVSRPIASSFTRRRPAAEPAKKETAPENAADTQETVQEQKAG